jgi:hypothetical protein
MYYYTVESQQPYNFVFCFFFFLSTYYSKCISRIPYFIIWKAAYSFLIRKMPNCVTPSLPLESSCWDPPSFIWCFHWALPASLSESINSPGQVRGMKFKWLTCGSKTPRMVYQSFRIRQRSTGKGVKSRFFGALSRESIPWFWNGTQESMCLPNITNNSGIGS